MNAGSTCSKLLPAFALGALACAAVSFSAAQEANEEPAPSDVFPLERVALANGREYQGYIRAELPGEIEFVEVVRPAGKPMYLIVRPIDRAAIVEMKRLNETDLAELVRRIDRYRYRSLIETKAMERLAIERVAGVGGDRYRYRGAWFTLWSTADEEMTRRTVVRIEQIFLAYRQFVPPRVEPRGDLQIHIHGSMDEYWTYLRAQGLSLDNPAFYSPQRNTIVAGSELTRFSEQLAAIRGANEAELRKYRQMNEDLPRQAAQYAYDLRRQKIPDEEIGREVAAFRADFEREFKSVETRIAEANRRNNGRFRDLTRRMFTRLYHEAFHAYLENFVYPHRQHDVPAWLNEGLAQVFENGQLDADVLRIDAPSAAALEIIRADLARGEPLPLSELLTAAQPEFLALHDPNQTTRRIYAYSWGIAYYLTFERELLSTPGIDRYVSPDAAALHPVERFEQLVEQPLAEFERDWRRAMLRLAQAEGERLQRNSQMQPQPPRTPQRGRNLLPRGRR